MENILLVSDVMIKERTAIHGNIDPKLIYPDIKVAQDMYIMPVLGSTLFNKLQSLINAGTITTPGFSNYKLLIDKYIADSLIYHTLAELPTTLSYQFWNKGVVRKQGDSTELPSMSELIDLSNKYKNRGEFYDNRLRKYLMQNTSLYPEYTRIDSGFDVVPPDEKSFTMPVWLGCDDDDNGCSCGTIYTTYQETKNNTFNVEYQALGSEGSIINVSNVEGLKQLVNTELLLVSREDKVLYKSATQSGPVGETEYRFINGAVLQLGSGMTPGERFLFIIKK